MDAKQLRKYLEEVRVLEMELYTIRQTMSYLKSAQKASPQKRTIIPPLRPATREPEKPKLVSKKEKKQTSILGTIVIMLLAALGASDCNTPGEAILMLSLAGLFCAAAIAFDSLYTYPIRDKKRLLKYTAELEAYNAEIADYEQQLEAFHKETAVIEKQYELELNRVNAYNTYLDEQFQEYAKKESVTYLNLNDLYHKEIVHPNYWGLVPITRFCEYMDTGRRTQLSGKGEMYDLYEEELMHQRIVHSLDVVNSNLRTIGNRVASISSQLTGIQRNQTMLYEEVAKGNESARKIQEDTQRMWKQLEKQEGRLAAISDSAETAALHSAETARHAQTVKELTESQYYREFHEN